MKVPLADRFRCRVGGSVIDEEGSRSAPSMTCRASSSRMRRVATPGRDCCRCGLVCNQTLHAFGICSVHGPFTELDRGNIAGAQAGSVEGPLTCITNWRPLGIRSPEIAGRISSVTGQEVPRQLHCWFVVPRRRSAVSCREDLDATHAVREMS